MTASLCSDCWFYRDGNQDKVEIYDVTEIPGPPFGQFAAVRASDSKPVRVFRNALVTPQRLEPQPPPTTQ